MENGHQIIIAVDINEDVTSTRIKDWADNLGLTEVTSQSEELKIPTVNNGSVQIDGIFVSNTLTTLHRGFLGFGIFTSNHRGIWADFDTNSIFGFQPQTSTQHKARRLQCSIPSVMKRW